MKHKKEIIVINLPPNMTVDDAEKMLRELIKKYW